MSDNHEKFSLKITDPIYIQERAEKGYCRSDVFQMNGWLVTIIPAMLRDLIRENNTYLKDETELDNYIETSMHKLPVIIRLLEMADRKCDSKMAAEALRRLGESMDDLWF